MKKLIATDENGDYLYEIKNIRALLYHKGELLVTYIDEDGEAVGTSFSELSLGGRTLIIL